MGVQDQDSPVSIGGPRQRRLLALLAVRAGSVCGSDWLAEHLWVDGDRPAKPAQAIRTYMSRLRQALPEDAQDWLRTEPTGYVLDAPVEALEHRRFAALRAQAQRSRASNDPLAALQLLDDALALWRGGPFQELEDSDVARPTIEQLHLDRLEMLEERWESALALGRHTQITGELAVFAAEHRHRDRATRQYALALYRSGRTAEALRVIADHRQFLGNESGIEPSAEMAELEQAMFAGDDSLQVETVGRPLRGYRLLDEIGSGAFSIVWRGMQPSVGRQVAIKQIRSELASQPEFIRRFEAEAHLIARIEHPHIVPLIDFWRDPDSAYLVMRLLRGDTLERRLDDGPLRVDQTLTLAQQIGGALSAAHAHNIIHRDVKTGNIMFDESGNAFLGDFGIALEATESTGPSAAFSTGSPAYSAPEQIRREPLGPQADVFSLGVVLFECITGVLPFRDTNSVAELVERQLHSDYPPVTDLRPDTPAHISDSIAKATAKDPADRFGSVAEFIDTLDPPRTQDASQNATVGLATNLPNPYLGLSAFDEADRDNFFGRESLVTTLLERLRGSGLASRCIGVVGPSGSGKSSVVRAGLSPAVRAGAIPGSDQWFASTMVPGGDPFESLEAALLRVAINPPDSLLTQLHDGPRGVLRCLRRCLDNDDRKIYLVIDQFEEIFTAADSQVAFDFLTALAVAVEDPKTPLRLVFTLRADYYDRPLSHPTFAHILDATSANVTPLSADELERAMVEPAKRLGVGFEPGLVALIVADCIGQLAPLPLLQYTLSELFENRHGGLLTVATYEEMGRLTGALAGRAEAIHGRATTTQQAAIRRTFGRMINPAEEAADLRRRARVQDLGDDPDTAWVLEQFGTARLVTFDRDPSSREPTVEVAHEALLREWPRLSTWLNEDRDLLRSSEMVAHAADEWVVSGRPEADLYRGARLESAVALRTSAPDRLRAVDADFINASERRAERELTTEKRRGRRLRQLLVGVGAALVIALVAGGVAFSQRGRANEQADLAQSQATLADEQSKRAQDSAREAEAQTALAEEQTRIANDAADEAQAQAELADQQTALVLDAAARAETAALISQAESIAGSDDELSILLALEAHRREPSPATQQAVVKTFATSTLVNRLSSLAVPPGFPPAGCDPLAIMVNPQADTGYFSTGDQLLSRHIDTGLVTEHGPPPTPCVSWYGSADADRRVAFSPDGNVWLASFEGPWVLHQEFDRQIRAVQFSGFNATHRHVFIPTNEQEAQTAVLVDDITGETVGAPITGPGLLTTAAASPDGTYIAVGFDGDSGVAIIVDAETGTELHRSTGITPVTFGFDLESNELLLGTAEQTVVISDLATGEVVATVPTSAAWRLLDVSLRSDGALVVTSTDQVEVIDRQTGSTSESLPLSNMEIARLRTDGSLFAVSATNRAEMFSLAANAALGSRIELSQSGASIFANGSLVVNVLLSGSVTSVELATGEQTPVSLRTPEGGFFDTRFVAREPNGFLAFSEDAQIARWENGEMVESIAPWGEGEVSAREVYFGDGLLLLAATSAAVGFELRSFNTLPGELAQVASVAVTDIIDLVADDAGGIHVWSGDGIVRSFDADGGFVGQVVAGLETTPGLPSGAASSKDHLAFGSGDGGVIIERATGEVTRLPALMGRVASLDFARDGSILVVAGSDGTVRTWDVHEKATRDVIGQDSTAIQFGLWVDDATDSAWVATSDGQVVNLPLDFAAVWTSACAAVSRNLTQQEWDLYVPGDDPLQSACEEP